MNAPQTHAPEEMNWADYWDSLTDEFFKRRASAELPPALEASRMVDRAAQTVARRTAASEPA